MELQRSPSSEKALDPAHLLIIVSPDILIPLTLPRPLLGLGLIGFPLQAQRLHPLTPPGLHPPTLLAARIGIAFVARQEECVFRVRGEVGPAC